MEYVEVASVEDLVEGGMIRADVGGNRVLVAVVEGKPYAMGAVCTHERAFLDEGGVVGHEVTCPLHFSCFDVRTGEVTAPPAEDAEPVYEVKIEDGKVLVSSEPVEEPAEVSETLDSGMTTPKPPPRRPHQTKRPANRRRPPGGTSPRRRKALAKSRRLLPRSWLAPRSALRGPSAPWSASDLCPGYAGHRTDSSPRPRPCAPGRGFSPAWTYSTGAGSGMPSIPRLATSRSGSGPARSCSTSPGETNPPRFWAPLAWPGAWRRSRAASRTGASPKGKTAGSACYTGS